MKFKHKLMTAASTALVAAMLPINAFAAVQVDIYGDRRVSVSYTHLTLPTKA